MSINGYTNVMSVQPGQEIKFMVNSSSSSYTTDIVRLIHGDSNPEGPGFKTEHVDADVNKRYNGRIQDIHMGSYIKAENSQAFDVDSFSLQAMIYPTTPHIGVQGLLTKWSGQDDTGYGLFINEDGYLSLRIGHRNGKIEELTLRQPLIYSCWFFVGASFDSSTGTMRLFQEPVLTKTNSQFSLPYDIDNYKDKQEKQLDVIPNFKNASSFVIGSALENLSNNKDKAVYRYNGKIDRPRIFNRSLTKEVMASQIDDPTHESIVAAWDFSVGITKEGIKNIDKIHDSSPNELHGTAVNSPTRAVTGYNWTGKEANFIHAPEEYGAIHFHMDDLTDANWDVDFVWQVPETLPSGVYAAHVQQDDDEDYIVFFVRPKKNKPTSKIALLMPTASYLAYANNRFQDSPLAQVMFGRAPVVELEDLYLGEHAEYGLSTYDEHIDGTGVCFSSALRPILNMRPLYRHNLSPSLWQFNADLHLVDWLTEKGYQFDVITDQDLHQEGASLLNQYRVVMTGSHPEYYSGNMMDGVEEFQANGGRFMYMGANGFYWVVNFNEENPNIMEVRKNFGNSAWKTLPGENYLSTSGEFGTIWKHRGRAPQKVCGTGYMSQGFEVSSYYRRTDESYDSELDWIFEGITDEKLGDFGLVGGGAAGIELDVASVIRGTPPHARIIATSEDHSAVYMPVADELDFNIPGLPGDENPNVRADMVYYPTPNGGAVFSTSSIAYCGSLSHNNYDNNISKLTENVLNRFLSEEPLS